MFTFPLPYLTINNYLREEENFVDKLVSFEGFHDLSPQTTFHIPIPQVCHLTDCLRLCWPLT